MRGLGTSRRCFAAPGTLSRCPAHIGCERGWLVAGRPTCYAVCVGAGGKLTPLRRLKVDPPWMVLLRGSVGSDEQVGSFATVKNEKRAATSHDFAPCIEGAASGRAATRAVDPFVRHVSLRCFTARRSIYAPIRSCRRGFVASSAAAGCKSMKPRALRRPAVRASPTPTCSSSTSVAEPTGASGNRLRPLRGLDAVRALEPQFAVPLDALLDLTGSRAGRLGAHRNSATGPPSVSKGGGFAGVRPGLGYALYYLDGGVEDAIEALERYGRPIVVLAGARSAARPSRIRGGPQIGEA